MTPLVSSFNFTRDDFLRRFKLTDGTDAARIAAGLDRYSGNLLRVEMNRLSGVVVIAGPNGSGKSRTLGLLRHILDVASGNWPNAQRLSEGSEDGSYLRCLTLNSSLQPMRVNLPSRVPEIRQVSSATQGDYDAASKRLDASASEFEENGALAAIMARQCHSEMWDAHHPQSLLPTSRKLHLVERWENWVTLVRDLLKKRLQADSSRRLSIDDIPLDEAVQYFSDGEKRLFSLSASLVCGDTTNRSRVIICDEPENHLHPEAAVEVLTRVRAGLPNDQLWIATHSLPIIAALGWENVFVARAGTISFAGRNTDLIVEGLLGGKDNSARLRSLIDEPARAAIIKFAAECLIPPPLASADQNDPQYRAALPHLAGESSPVRTLDWGAGTGRLPFYLSMEAESVRASIEYYGYEPDNTKHRACLENIAKLVPTADVHLFGTVDQLQGSSRLGAFDRVLLCNVLHEIPISQWQDTFAQIALCLSKNGALIILEDSQLPVGELPTHEGFLLLTPDAAKTLFAIPGEVQQLVHKDPKYAARLKGFWVPKTNVESVTRETIMAAARAIGSAALSEIKSHRAAAVGGNLPIDYRAGLSHALNLVQFANATLAEDQLRSAT